MTQSERTIWVFIKAGLDRSIIGCKSLINFSPGRTSNVQHQFLSSSINYRTSVAPGRTFIEYLPSATPNVSGNAIVTFKIIRSN